MESLLDHFPVFEANQVLTSGHLNDAFDYLDQQERQTRSHLIGIGIVCGLEIGLAGATISLSKGCGVTSEGYLIVEPHDVSFVAYRNYTLPPQIGYPQFMSGTKQIALWELFEAGTPNTTLFNSPANFLDDKAVVLFLELNMAPLRVCNPVSCDDKGSQVTATVRRLLIARSDLDAIIAAANALGGSLTVSDINAALATRLNLPDLRLRRFDVLNSNPVTSNDVYRAFLDMIRTGGLANAVGGALTAAFTAFQPLLATSFPTNPFANFVASYGFLDTTPANVTQVRFLQYYADLFDDLLCAYDEFRWKGLELICACCPDDGLFPRHLMLGLLNPATVAQPDIYRQSFEPSPAVGDCAAKTREVVQLFARLVEMTARFTDAPALPKTNPSLTVDPQIRVTPSRLCCTDDALSNKAIPYYYAQTGAPPLYQLWSPTKTRRNRANQNFSYNADLYANPAAPAFVIDPLRYDLDGCNFLRIEGHLGKNYQAALRSLLTLKAQYRLPIDVIALRTGAYDDSQPVDLTQEQARFQDLEALYEALRGELMSELAEGVMQLYGRVIPAVAGLTLNAGTPNLPVLKQYAPHYGYPANTIGAWYENYLNLFENQGFLQVDPNAVDANAVLRVYCTLFNHTLPPEAAAFPHVVAIYYISKLSEIVPPQLGSLNYAAFESRYQDLMALIRYFRSDAIASVTPDLKNFLPEDEFIDLCEGILFGCKLDAIKAVNDDYVARIGDLKRRQFLSSFLQEEPGVQHKAGVPLGGTFILVYHGTPELILLTGGARFNFGLVQQEIGAAAARMRSAPALTESAVAEAATTASPSPSPLGAAETSAVMRAIGNISANRTLIANNDVSLLVGMLTGQIPIASTTGDGLVISTDPAAKIINATVGELANGAVIADFFLPYRIAAYPGAQYVLPLPVPTFTVAVACTAADGNAAVTIQAKGGLPPYDVSVDHAAYQALSGPLQLPAGDHSIMLRDAEGAETQAQIVTVAPPIVISAPTYVCADSKYTGTAAITGGTPPYMVNGKALSGASIVTDPTASGTALTLTVTDSKGCTATASFSHVCPPPCTLPCAGIALNRGFRFFIPDADAGNAYQSLEISGVTFTVESAPGRSVDLSAAVAPILRATPAQLAAAQFAGLVAGWLKAINTVVASNAELVQAGKAQWLTLAYRASAPGRLGTLFIDYFECLKFSIQLTVIYALASGRQSLRISYTPDGTSIQMGDFSATMPAYDGTTTDKCSETPTATNLCPVTPDFSVQIQRVATTDPNAGNFTAVTSATGLTFLWEVQDATPAMGNGQNFSTRFASSGRKLVTLTAFNSKGCSATASLTVQVG
jgi:hypothetical protein